MPVSRKPWGFANSIRGRNTLVRSRRLPNYGRRLPNCEQYTFVLDVIRLVQRLEYLALFHPVALAQGRYLCLFSIRRGGNGIYTSTMRLISRDRDRIRANALFIARKSFDSFFSVYHPTRLPRTPVPSGFLSPSRFRIHIPFFDKRKFISVSKTWSTTLSHQRSALGMRRATFCLGDMFTKSKHPFSLKFTCCVLLAFKNCPANVDCQQ